MFICKNSGVSRRNKAWTFLICGVFNMELNTHITVRKHWKSDFCLITNLEESINLHFLCTGRSCWDFSTSVKYDTCFQHLPLSCNYIKTAGVLKRIWNEYVIWLCNQFHFWSYRTRGLVRHFDSLWSFERRCTARMLTSRRREKQFSSAFLYSSIRLNPLLSFWRQSRNDGVNSVCSRGAAELCVTHIIGQLLDPSRESPGVSLQAALGVPIVGGPAVIQAHILVSGLLPALLHHHVCHLHVQALAAGVRWGDRQGP